MADKKHCFIIMPITTPESMVEKYRDGPGHFKHVLDCLFMPAVSEAGYNPIPPIAKGSDLIQAEIIENLETADLVLCDISSLNPNVFFEFGIRTSLNKPVCVVKDDLTKKVPFDTGIINHHEYQNLLESWHIKTEIKNLADHIKTSAERSRDENTLWRYFGIKTKAEPYQGEAGPDAKFAHLSDQVDLLGRKIDQIFPPTPTFPTPPIPHYISDMPERDDDLYVIPANSEAGTKAVADARKNVIRFFRQYGVEVLSTELDIKNRILHVGHRGALSDDLNNKLSKHAWNTYGLKVVFILVE